MKNKSTLIVLGVLLMALGVFSLRVYNDSHEVKPLSSRVSRVQEDSTPSVEPVRLAHVLPSTSVGGNTSGLRRITVGIKAGIGQEDQQFAPPTVTTDGTNKFMFPSFVARKGLTSNSWQQIRVLRASASLPPLMVDPVLEGGPVVLLNAETNTQNN